MQLSAADRAQANLLQRPPPSQHRNASVSTRSWSNPATPIQTPSTTEMNKRRRHDNPYAAGRMSSNLRNELGNPNKDATPVAHYKDSRPSKRKKVDYQPHIPASRVESSKARGQILPRASPHGAVTSSSSDPRQEIIDIDGLDEDIGQRVVQRPPSPDLLDIITGRVSDEPLSQVQYASRYDAHRQPDGESTSRVRKAVDPDWGDDHDSVQSASGFDEEPAARRPSNRRTPTGETLFPGVQDKIGIIESKSKAFSTTGKLTDLSLLAKQPVKSKMRGNQVRVISRAAAQTNLTWRKLRMEREPIQDPIATASSGFTSGKRKAQAARRVINYMPISFWVVGCELCSDGDKRRSIIEWNSHTNDVFWRRSNPDGSELLLSWKGKDVQSIKAIDPKRIQVDAMIQIQFQRGSSVPGAFAGSLEIGSTHHDGRLTLQFDTKRDDWDVDTYSDLLDGLRREAQVEWIELRASLDLYHCQISVMNAAREALEYKAKKDERSQGMMEIDQPSLRGISSKPKPKPTYHGKDHAPEPVRRSSRLSGQDIKQLSPRPDPDEVILGYRSGTGSLNITNADLGRLKPGEFLNDTLIEFGLKLWWADIQQQNPQLAEEIHVFNSFFYKKLSNKNPEDGYQSVRKWTQKFDLFKKKYVIVPINENLHWYLAIIYMPEYVLQPPPADKSGLALRRSTRHLGVDLEATDAAHSAESVTTATSSYPTPDDSPVPATPHFLGPPLHDPRRDGLPTDSLIAEASLLEDPSAEASIHKALGSPSRSASVVPATPEADRVEEENDVEAMIRVNNADFATRSLSRMSLEASADPVSEGSSEDIQLLYPRSASPVGAALEVTAAAEKANIAANSLASSTRNDGRSTSTSGVSPHTFYGKSGMEKGKRKATPFPDSWPTVARDDLMDVEEVADPFEFSDTEDDIPSGSQVTQIYIFDSLSSKHKRAIDRLKVYLQLEAKDKKNLDKEATTVPEGKHALVPHQPNYCDCGIYLLHFAKTFMKNPALSSQIIHQTGSPQKVKGKRSPHEHWDGASVGTYREELSMRIKEMSEAWKRERTEREEQKKKEEEATREASGEKDTPAASTNVESDSDIEVVQTVEQPKTRKGRKKATGQTKGAAARIR
ncbi:hypothetical protein BV25DRAFT_1916654 [Artomyces pyxidatus]|uniref:Uncharacterized protein n=1 Tax=Artomyces pyxidatus TaxID=48021 RepID=A0ACB8SZM6_9AGAM|nr:hypothetical protein BV25DRAFT_1916654 [Artomyces pyxidatus]